MDNTDQTAFQRILFCTDLSDNADFAFDFALDAAKRRPGSKLYILHVIPESEAQFWKTYIYEVDDVDNKAKHDLNRHIARAYLDKIDPAIETTVEYRVGKDSQQILEFADEKQADLIVMGRQGRGALQKALFGNVTEKVVRKAKCAALVVPLSYQRKIQPDR